MRKVEENKKRMMMKEDILEVPKCSVDNSEGGNNIIIIQKIYLYYYN